MKDFNLIMKSYHKIRMQKDPVSKFKNFQILNKVIIKETGML